MSSACARGCSCLLAAAGAAAVRGHAPRAAAPSKRFRYTHRVGPHRPCRRPLDDQRPDYCGRVGDGTVTVKFRMTKPTKVRLVHRPVRRRADNRSRSAAGCSASPTGGGIGHMRRSRRGHDHARRQHDARRCRPTGGDCGSGHDKSGLRHAPAGGGRSSTCRRTTRHQLVADLGPRSQTIARQGGRRASVGELGRSAAPPSITSGRATRRAARDRWRAPRRAPPARRHASSARRHKHSAFTECVAVTPARTTSPASVTVTFKTASR